MAASREGKAIFSTDLGRHPSRAVVASPPPFTIVRSTPLLHDDHFSPDVAKYAHALWQRYPGECAKIDQGSTIIDYFDFYDIHVFGREFLETVLLCIANQNVVDFSYRWTLDHREKVYSICQALEPEEVFDADDFVTYGANFLKDAYKHMRRGLRALQKQKKDKELPELQLHKQGESLQARHVNEKATEESVILKVDALKVSERRVLSGSALEVPLNGANSTFSDENIAPAGARIAVASSVPVTPLVTPAAPSSLHPKNNRSASALRVETPNMQVRRLSHQQVHAKGDQQILSLQNQQPLSLIRGPMPTPSMQQAHLAYPPGAPPPQVQVVPMHQGILAQPVFDVTGTHMFPAMYPCDPVYPDSSPALYPTPLVGQLYQSNNFSRGQIGNRRHSRGSFSNNIVGPRRMSSGSTSGRGCYVRGGHYGNVNRHEPVQTIGPRRDSIRSRYEQSHEYHTPAYEQTRGYRQGYEQFPKLVPTAPTPPDGEYGCDKHSIGSDREDINDLWVSGFADDVTPADLTQHFEQLVAINRVTYIRKDSTGAAYAFVLFHKTADARKALELNETLFRGHPLMVQVPEKYWRPPHQRRYSQTYTGSLRGGYGELQRRLSIQSKDSWEGSNRTHINRRRSSLLSQAADMDTERVDPSHFSPQDARSGITVPRNASGEDRGEGSKLYRPRTKSSGSSPKKSGRCTPSDRNDSGSTDAPASMQSSSGTGRSSPADVPKFSKPLSRKDNKNKNKNKKNGGARSMEAAPAPSEEPLRKPSQIHTIVESPAEIDVTQSLAATVPTPSVTNAPLVAEPQAIPTTERVEEFASGDSSTIVSNPRQVQDEARILAEISHLPNKPSVPNRDSAIDTNEAQVISNTSQVQEAGSAVQSEGPLIVSSTAGDIKHVNDEMAAITVSIPKRDESSDKGTSVHDAESPASSKTVTVDLSPSGAKEQPACPASPVLSPNETLPTVKLPEAEPTPVQTQPAVAESSAPSTTPSTTAKPTINDTGSIHPFAKKNKPKKPQPRKPKKGEAKKQKKEQEAATRKDSRVSSGSIESNTTTTLSDNTHAANNAAGDISEMSQPNAEVATPQKTKSSGTPSPSTFPEDLSSPIQHFEDARESVSPKTSQPADSPPTLPASPTTTLGEEQTVNPMAAASAPEESQPVEVAQAPATLVKPAATGGAQEGGGGGGQAVAGSETLGQAAAKKKNKSKKKKKSKKSVDSAATAI